jgi:YidC/Oxa1 family membrane protein insertase
MPILFGLYSALVILGTELEAQPWFFIPDLGIPEYTQGMSWIPEFAKAGMAIPAGMEYLGKSGYYLLVAYLILPILLMVTQFIMQKWMTPAPTGPESQAAGMTRQVGLMMTFMFGFFTLQVPAGLTLYWVTSNLLQMLQQWAITSDRFNLSKVTIKESVLAPSSDDEEEDDDEGQPASNAAPATASQSAAKTRSSKSRRSKRK